MQRTTEDLVFDRVFSGDDTQRTRTLCHLLRKYPQSTDKKPMSFRACIIGSAENNLWLRFWSRFLRRWYPEDSNWTIFYQSTDIKSVGLRACIMRSYKEQLMTSTFIQFPQETTTLGLALSSIPLDTKFIRRGLTLNSFLPVYWYKVGRI